MDETRLNQFHDAPNGLGNVNERIQHRSSEGKEEALQNIKNVTNSVSPAASRLEEGLLEKKRSSWRNFRKVLIHGLARCFITWLLIMGFYVSLWKYKSPRVISPKMKSGFDAITVALSIAFGLNIASSLKGVALNVRWWILSMKRRPSHEVDLILHCDSMTDLLKLAVFVRRPKMILASVSWLSLNMLAQTGIAILSLTYSAIPGIEDIYRDKALTNISIPDLETFTPTSKFQEDGDNLALSNYGAHMLGDIGSTYNFSMLPDHHYNLTGEPWASNPAAFWNATDHWKYVALDSALSVQSGLPNHLSIYTDRSVRSSGTCRTPNFTATVQDYITTVHTYDGAPDVEFPNQSFENSSDPATYYLTIPTWADAQDGHVPCATCGDCGLGCSNVKALETRLIYSPDGVLVNASGFYYYDCNITVASETSYDPTFLDYNTAATAAQAIALSGDFDPNSPIFPVDSAYYLPGLTFGEPQNGSAAAMASLISRFAIGVVAAAAKTNQGLVEEGHAPMQGLRITLDRPVMFGLILALTAGIQVLLVLMAAFLCRRLVVPEEVRLSHEEEIRRRFVLESEEVGLLT